MNLAGTISKIIDVIQHPRWDAPTKLRHVARACGLPDPETQDWSVVRQQDTRAAREAERRRHGRCVTCGQPNDRPTYTYCTRCAERKKRNAKMRGA